MIIPWRKLKVWRASQGGVQVERVSLGSITDIRDVVTPLWRVSYERQLEMKKGQLEAGLRKLLRLLKKKTPKGHKRFDLCYQSYKAQVCACFFSFFFFSRRTDVVGSKPDTGNTGGGLRIFHLSRASRYRSSVWNALCVCVCVSPCITDMSAR